MEDNKGCMGFFGCTLDMGSEPMYIIVNDNLEYVNKGGNLGPREKAVTFNDSDEAGDMAFRVANESREELAVIDAETDEIISIVGRSLTSFGKA